MFSLVDQIVVDNVFDEMLRIAKGGLYWVVETCFYHCWNTYGGRCEPGLSPRCGVKSNWSYRNHIIVFQKQFQVVTDCSCVDIKWKYQKRSPLQVIEYNV
nr:hypothetical protein [Tanacetum cinerariifolium]